jgi:hypothetical protein
VLFSGKVGLHNQRVICRRGRVAGRSINDRGGNSSARPLGDADELAERGVDGSPVGKICGHVGGEEDEIGARAIARGIFAADAALEFG